MATYGDRPSSREKDLVDLVVLAVTQEVSGSDLAFAITSEARRRSMEPFTTFVAPAAWGRRYGRIAKPVPYCADYQTVAEARELMATFIDPVLSGAASDRTWSRSRRAWL